MTIDLPLWSFEEREAYVSERLKAHLDARENLLNVATKDAGPVERTGRYGRAILLLTPSA